MTRPRALRQADEDSEESSPQRFGRGLTIGVVAAILLVGLIASAILYRQADRDAEREEAGLAARAGRVLESSGDALIAAFSGGSGIVDESGVVDESAFNAFAQGIVDTTLITVVAYEQIVSDAERAAFEAEAGFPITKATADGFVPADRHDAYVPVRFLQPPVEPQTSLYGFDIASDADRAATLADALSTGSIVFSSPLPSQPTGQLGFFVAQPLFQPGAPIATADDRNAAIVGYLSALIPATTLFAAVTDEMPSGARVSIDDGDTQLIATDPPPTNGQSVVVEQAGRAWTVTVEHHDADHSMAILLSILTVLTASWVGVTLWRSSRQTGELRSAAAGVRHLGQLTERLTMAETREEMLSIIYESARSTAGAQSISVGFPSEEPGVLSVFHDHAAGEGHVDVPLDRRRSIITDAWNSNSSVFVGDGSAIRLLYPASSDDAGQHPVDAAAAIPMRRPNGERLGVLAWRWSRPNRFRDGLRSTLVATAEVCQQGFHRADLLDVRFRAASSMSALSQRLSVARGVEQIAAAAIELGPDAASSDFVGFGLLSDSSTAVHLFHIDPAGEAPMVKSDFPIDPSGPALETMRQGRAVQFDDRVDLERYPAIAAMMRPEVDKIVCLPLLDSTLQLRGVIAFLYLRKALASKPEAGRLDTIADLTAQTLERALLYQHEHEVVVNLQRQTLADLPQLDGLQIAARYLPASSTLGLGGDWYDVHPLDDGRVGVVVGDVSGHGFEAIADMAEFRTTISTLLRTAPDLAQIPAQSTALLRTSSTDVRFATAGLMVIDGATMSYVRAGHPPTIIRSPSGEVTVLESPGAPPIGVVETTAQLDRVDVAPGSVIVAYTDGLIERRHELIDLGLARLAQALRDCASSDVEVIADALVDECLGGRDTEDDAALLVIRVEV